MSLLPYFYDIRRRPQHQFDQHFGMELFPNDIFHYQPLISSDYIRPWCRLPATLRDTGSTITTDKDKFQVSLDVQHFAPEEITVKTHDGCVIVEGKHEEKVDEHGFISRQFVRRYALPEGCLADTVKSSLSSDGVLTVSAPRKLALPDKNERIVPIQFQPTSPVHRQISVHEEEKTEDAK